MKSIKLVLLAAVASLAALALAGTASATFINGGVTGTTIHATITPGTNSTFTAGSTVVTCTSATMHGTLNNVGTAGSGNVWVDNNLASLSWSGCTESALGSSVNVTTPCSVGSSFSLGVNYNSGSPSARFGIPSGCQILIEVPLTGCKLTISSQTVSGGVYNQPGSMVDFGASQVGYTSNNTGFGCPAAGTGTYMGGFQLDMNPTVVS